MRRGVRTNSGMPSSASSRAICRLSVALGTPLSASARVRLPWVINSTKCSTSRMSIMAVSVPQMEQAIAPGPLHRPAGSVQSGLCCSIFRRIPDDCPAA
jgi:hypothetical protein